MKISQTAIPGLLTLEPRVFGDPRGAFFESYNRRELSAAGIDAQFVQDNQSVSVRNVLRGLHYQVEQPQGKLVRVAVGEVFDVAVDLRSGSRTYGTWEGVHLSAANHRMLWIPPGFAHGFLVLSEHAVFLYKTTAYYAPQHERCIRWDDPTLAIDWPLDGAPILSAKDSAGSFLEETGACA